MIRLFGLYLVDGLRQVDLDPPVFVSVLYVQVPAGLQGGHLRLYLGDDSCVGTLAPVANVLVLFQGLFWPAFMVYQSFRALAG